MWIVYLRFDENKEIKTYHVLAPNKVEAEELLSKAEKHGLSREAKLAEYAVFYAHGTIKPKQVPNFHFYKHNDFLSRWQSMEDGEKS